MNTHTQYTAADIPTRAALSYLPTELGNAQRLADESNGDVRWHPGRGWLCWTGTHWRTEDYLAPRMAADSARRYLLEAVHGGSLEQKKWGLASESSRCIDATLKLLRAVPGIPITEDELDTDPWLLSCANGTIDLKTGSIRPHARDDYITMCAPATYDEDAAYAEWAGLMTKCHPGTSVPYYLQLVIGYGLTGLTREQMFVIHTGSGANGKGTFMHGLTSALGNYTRTAQIASFLKSRNESGTAGATPDVMAMAGARLIFAEEPDVAAKLNEGKLKNLTGQGRIRGRMLYRDETEFEPKFLLQLLTNHLPTVWGRDEGIWRRVQVVPWEQDFRSERDMGIYDRVASWRDQILTWAVHGAAMYYELGTLDRPEEVVRANAAYREENDRLSGWFPGLWEKGDTFTPRAEIANDYATWVRAEHGEDARGIPPKALYDALRKAGSVEHKREGVWGFYLTRR